MRVHDVRDPEGRIFAFEVSNVLLGRRGVRRVIGTIPSATIVRFSARAEEFCEFELDGTTFVAWEPWNDSSRYWIGAKPPHAGANLSTLRAAFERARPMFGFLLPARKEPARR